VLETLAARGIGIINASALSMGLLTPQGPPPWHPARPELRAACAAAAKLCADCGVNLARLALHFSLGDARIATTLVSAHDEQTLASNIALVAGGAALTPTEEATLADVRALLTAPAVARYKSWEGVEVEKYWSKVGRTLVAEWYAGRRSQRAAGGGSGSRDGEAGVGPGAGLGSAAMTALHNAAVASKTARESAS
jgi:hypothetical protein